MDILEEISLSPKYAVGDIVRVTSTGAYFLIESIEGYEYCFRVLDINITRRDSIFYIDQHTNITKVA